jgi:DNA-binding response OmpR family regulator
MKKLLVIEEDTDVREMLVFTFENNGYEVIKSGKGISLAEIIQINPNVIVVGHLLSNTPGNDICVKLKADQLAQNIPVILYSANMNIEKISQGSCADGFVGKPLELEDLVYLVHRLAFKN